MANFIVAGPFWICSTIRNETELPCLLTMLSPQICAKPGVAQRHRFFKFSFSSRAMGNSLCKRLFSSNKDVIVYPACGLVAAEASLVLVFNRLIQVWSVGAGIPNSFAALFMGLDFKANLIASS